MKKTNILKLFILLMMIVLSFSSCKTCKTCPAYSQNSIAPSGSGGQEQIVTIPAKLMLKATDAAV